MHSSLLRFQNCSTAKQLTLFTDEYATLNMVLDLVVYLTVIRAVKFVPRYSLFLHVIGPCWLLFSSFIFPCDLQLRFYHLIFVHSLFSNLDLVKLYDLFLCFPGVLYCMGEYIHKTLLRTANHKEGCVSVPSNTRYMCICVFLCANNRPLMDWD